VSDPPKAEPAGISEQVHLFCGHCHVYPPPETFPRSAWRKEVERGYEFYEKSDLDLPVPPLPAVVKYYEARAPLALQEPEIKRATTPVPVQFEQVGWPGPNPKTMSVVSNVNLVHLSDSKRLDILTCDMDHHDILALQPLFCRF